MPTIELFTAFIHRLHCHDWYFQFSDDHSVWQRGNKIQQELQAIAKSHDFYDQAYQAFIDCMYSNDDPKTACAIRDQKIEEIRNAVYAAANTTSAA